MEAYHELLFEPTYSQWQSIPRSSSQHLTHHPNAVCKSGLFGFFIWQMSKTPWLFWFCPSPLKLHIYQHQLHLQKHFKKQEIQNRLHISQSPSLLENYRSLLQEALTHISASPKYVLRLLLNLNSSSNFQKHQSNVLQESTLNFRGNSQVSDASYNKIISLHTTQANIGKCLSCISTFVSVPNR